MPSRKDSISGAGKRPRPPKSLPMSELLLPCLDLNRSSFSYEPAATDPVDLHLMHRIDQ